MYNKVFLLLFYIIYIFICSYNIILKCKSNALANGIKGVVVHPSIIKIEN